MEEIISSTNTTNATSITMKNLFALPVIIEKFANFTKIACELNFTVFAIFLRLLNSFTFITLDFFNSLPVDLMILFGVHLIVIFCIIMAKSARKPLFAFRTFLRATPLIMFAA
jgi:hypothetical protein